MNLGKAITVARTFRGVSQVQLANGIGVDPSTVSRWEKGNRPCSLQQVDNIATDLGIPLYLLVLLADESEPDAKRIAALLMAG